MVHIDVFLKYFRSGNILVVLDKESELDDLSNEIKCAYVSEIGSVYNNGGGGWIKKPTPIPDEIKAKLADVRAGTNIVIDRSDPVRPKLSVTPATATEIKTSYESNADTNVFDDAAKAKLSNVLELEDNMIPSKYLPSYVDDIIELDTQSDLPSSGESGKIYVIKSNNNIYRWGGSSWVNLNANDLILGTTSTTAYRGDRGTTLFTKYQSDIKNLFLQYPIKSDKEYVAGWTNIEYELTPIESKCDYDMTDKWDGTTFTAPVEGMYAISYSYVMQADSLNQDGSFHIRFNKANGRNKIIGGQQSTNINVQPVSVGATVLLLKDQEVDVIYYSTVDHKPRNFDYYQGSVVFTLIKTIN